MRDSDGRLYTDRMSAGQKQLSAEMISLWGGFVTRGALANWATVQSRRGAALSLRPGGASKLVSTQSVSDGHHCGLWDDILGFGPTA